MDMIFKQIGSVLTAMTAIFAMAFMVLFPIYSAFILVKRIWE